MPTTAAGLANIGAPAAGAPMASEGGGADVNALIAQAGSNFADYQRLTAEGRLAEAGQKLEALKRALEQLADQQR
jgi:hypothetical protein